MLTGERLKFKSRKGQWRKRAIAQIELMVQEAGLYKKLSKPFRENLDQTYLEDAAKLVRMGVNGEVHLRNAIALDFSEEMRHDIRMMLLVIAAFSLTFRGKVSPHAVIFKPADMEVWEAKQYYPSWTAATRATWKSVMSKIGEMNYA